MPARPIPSASPSFLHSDRRLARVVAQPLRRFLHVEAAGGIVLVVAAVVALVWANVWPASYESVWSTEVRVEVGDYEFGEDLVHLVNDLLMGLFFFVVGMEIKRELVRRRAARPAGRRPSGDGRARRDDRAGADLLRDQRRRRRTRRVGGSRWPPTSPSPSASSPSSAARVPASIKVLLLTLAIVDDIGAIVVIAVFYTSGPRADVPRRRRGDRRRRRRHPPASTSPTRRSSSGLGLVLWLMVYESGVHATIAGVVMGLLTPAVPRQTDARSRRGRRRPRANRATSTPPTCAMAAWAIRGSISACDRLIDVLHPWTSYVIVPLFALANAGVELRRRRSLTRSVGGVRRRLPRPRRRQAGRHRGVLLAGGAHSDSGGCPPERGGGTSSASARSPGSASRCRCSSPGWPSTEVGLQDDAKIGTLERLDRRRPRSGGRVISSRREPSGRNQRVSWSRGRR